MMKFPKLPIRTRVKFMLSAVLTFFPVLSWGQNGNSEEVRQKEKSHGNYPHRLTLLRFDGFYLLPVSPNPDSAQFSLPSGGYTLLLGRTFMLNRFSGISIQAGVEWLRMIFKSRENRIFPVYDPAGTYQVIKVRGTYATVFLGLTAVLNWKKKNPGVHITAGVQGGYLFSASLKRVSKMGSWTLKERFSYVAGLEPVRLAAMVIAGYRDYALRISYRFTEIFETTRNYTIDPETGLYVITDAEPDPSRQVRKFPVYPKIEVGLVIYAFLSRKSRTEATDWDVEVIDVE